MMPFQVLLSRTISVLFLSYCSVSSTCYFPSGREVADIPCQNLDFATCCGHVDYCLSNGLCFSSTNVIMRGSCTDKTWSACRKVCMTDNPDSFNVIHTCGNKAFTCDGQSCSDINYTLPNAMIVLRDDQKQLSTNSCTSASTSIITTQDPSTAFTTTGSFLSSNFVCPSPTTCLCPSATCPTLESTPTNAGDSSQASKVVAVEAGVGVALGLVILAVVALFVVEKRRNRRLIQEKRRKTESYTRPTWVNQHGPLAEAPQDLAHHEMPSGPLAHEL